MLGKPFRNTEQAAGELSKSSRLLHVVRFRARCGRVAVHEEGQPTPAKAGSVATRDSSREAVSI